MRFSIPCQVTVPILLFASFSFAQPKPRLDAYGQPLPPGAIARLGQVKFGMLGSPVAVAWSPDSKKIAAVNNDEPHLIVWEWPSGRLLKDERLPHANWSRLLFSPDGKYLLWNDGYAGQGEASRLWNLEKDEKVAMPVVLNVIGRALAFSPDSKRLAIAASGIEVNEWTIGDTKVISHRGTRSNDHGIQFTSRNELLVAYGSKDSVTVLNVNTGKELVKVKVPELFYRPLGISPDGKWLAYQPDRQKVVFREIDGKREWSVPIDKQDITASLTFTPDSKVAAATMLGRMSQIELETGKVIFDKRHSMFIEAVFSPDGKHFATFGGNHDYAVLVFETATGNPISTSAGHTRDAVRTFWTHDSREIMTYGGSFGNTSVLFWNPRSGKQIRSWKVSYHGICFARDDRHALTTAEWGKFDRFIIWDMRTLDKVCVLPNPHPYFSGRFALSPDGSQLVTCGTGTSPDDAVMWDPIRAKKLWKGPLEFRTISAVELLPEESRVLVATNEGIFIIEYSEDGTPTPRQLVNVISPVVALTPDKKLLAITHTSSTGRFKIRTRILEMASGKEVLELGSDLHGISFAFSRDARSCLVGTPGGEIRLFDLPSAKELTAIPTGAGYGFSLSPDGRTLVCPGKGLDRITPLVWDVEKWTKRKRDGLNSATADQIATWCKQLRDLEASVGVKAAWGLADNPKLSVPAMQALFGKSPKSDATRVAQLIDDLNDRKFAVREAASRELIILGSAARDAIEQAIRFKTAPEQLDRLKSILAKIKDGASSEALFASRSVMALEWAGTREAKEVLEDAARRVPANAVAIEARRALSRWNGKP